VLKLLTELEAGHLPPDEPGAETLPTPVRQVGSRPAEAAE
jgi:hypothetical protein